jgi:murein DD-endopeptidase MepM/ murein hydrolase activator NlpD
VFIRDFYDNDQNVRVIESFTNCSLDPTLNNYVANKIGTSNGEYNLNSKYVMLEMGDEAPIDALPCGFDGYVMRSYASATPPFIVYKTKYLKPGDVVYNPPFGSTNGGDNAVISNGENPRKAYLGISNISGVDYDFFEYKGKIVYAFPYATNSSGKIEYYDDEGKTLKNFFLKTPIKFSRITSRYSSNRLHPVQGIWKAHKGTDYAAPYGTPITSTAAGVVEQTGFTTGNGNFVKVKHNGTYSTQYLHMSKILVRRGQHVNQGQIIGRVGSTGLATGPHVCYRFWKNGVQVDALRLKLPTGESMSGSSKQRFLQQIEPLKRQLDSVANL